MDKETWEKVMSNLSDKLGTLKFPEAIVNVDLPANNMYWDVKSVDDCLILELSYFSRDLNTDMVMVRLRFCGEERDKFIERIRNLK